MAGKAQAPNLYQLTEVGFVEELARVYIPKIELGVVFFRSETQGFLGGVHGEGGYFRTEKVLFNVIFQHDESLLHFPIFISREGLDAKQTPNDVEQQIVLDHHYLVRLVEGTPSEHFLDLDSDWPFLWKRVSFQLQHVGILFDFLSLFEVQDFVPGGEDGLVIPLKRLQRLLVLFLLVTGDDIGRKRLDLKSHLSELLCLTAEKEEELPTGGEKQLVH